MEPIVHPGNRGNSICFSWKNNPETQQLTAVSQEKLQNGQQSILELKELEEGDCFTAYSWMMNPEKRDSEILKNFWNPEKGDCDILYDATVYGCSISEIVPVMEFQKSESNPALSK